MIVPPEIMLHASGEARPVLRRVCVFCGSSSGKRAEYRTAVMQFGEALARRGAALVYGGGRVRGLLDCLASAPRLRDVKWETTV